MNKEQFIKLKVGDECVIKRGRDEGKLCSVLYIKNDSILVEAKKGTCFSAIGTNRKLRLTSYYELDIKPNLKTES